MFKNNEEYSKDSNDFVVYSILKEGYDLIQFIFDCCMAREMKGIINQYFDSIQNLIVKDDMDIDDYYLNRMICPDNTGNTGNTGNVTTITSNDIIDDVGDVGDMDNADTNNTSNNVDNTSSTSRAGRAGRARNKTITNLSNGNQTKKGQSDVFDSYHKVINLNLQPFITTRHHKHKINNNNTNNYHCLSNKHNLTFYVIACHRVHSFQFYRTLQQPTYL